MGEWYEKCDQGDDAEHKRGYNKILEHKQRLPPDQYFVADLWEVVVLDPVVIFDLLADGLVADQSPLVILCVVLQRGRLIYERVVQIGVCITPAAEDYDTQLIIKGKL